MADPPDNVELADKLGFVIDGHSADWQVMFAARALTAALSHICFERWETDEKTLDDGALEIELSRRDHESINAIVRVEECVARLCLAGGQLEASAAGPSPAAAQAALAAIRAAIPKREPVKQGPRLPFSFWTEDPYIGGGDRADRVLVVPKWSDVEANYSRRTRKALDELMRARPPSDAEGRMLLWHGSPGTGKTYALRALARAWREWCDVHVIADPEHFLKSMSYMDEVISGREDPERWRLVALEDTGELLSADARERVGHGLSRLLNATDGLLGQGTKFLVLITTNEPIGRLHPAVARPGRCLAEVEFAALPVDEANAWLDGRSNGRVSGPTPIAELFELVGKRKVGRTRPSRPPVGFALNGNR